MNSKELYKYIEALYPDNKSTVIEEINKLIDRWSKKEFKQKAWVDETDSILITYGDSILKDGEKPLKTLKTFLDNNVQDLISTVHLLPMYPYTSDDGFSVVDYRKINPELGTWENIKALSSSYDLMFDGVINHISKESDWFKGYLGGDKQYDNYFIECDPTADYSQVVRPRALPLLTKFDKQGKEVYVWTTFSDDQIDINFANYKVFIEIIDILLMYAAEGARFIRFDAIGFAWKKLGTSCIHLEETHMLIKIMRMVLDEVTNGTVIITETNVPHKENISYFGNGNDEAQMVYQFPLPPLTLYTFIKGDSNVLTKWADSLGETEQGTTFFNFLASHDGIGVRPTEGILEDEERQMMVDRVLEHGGKISYKNNPDGSKSPYELNISYMDALTHPQDGSDSRIKRFLASQFILLSLAGVPGIYIHSLLGSRNWLEGVEASGINRRINREKLDYDQLIIELETNQERNTVFNKYTELLSIRRSEKAFKPNSRQKVLSLNNKVFALIRADEVIAIVNIANEEVGLEMPFVGTDIITGKKEDISIVLAPYEYKWIKKSWYG